MNDLIYQPTTAQVSRALLNSGCYLIKDVEALSDPSTWFPWKSGIKAPVYTNCRHMNGSPGSTAIVAHALVNSIKHNFQGVELIIGIESAGIKWSTLVAYEMGLPDAFVRKEAKAHGVDGGRFVGGTGSLQGVSALIVDDLVASGGSLEDAIRSLREEKGVNVVGVQSIVNWNFNHMKERFRNLDVPIRALVSYPHLLDAARAQGIIDDDFRDELMFFYQNPKGHVFDFSFLGKTGMNHGLRNGTDHQ